MLYFNSPQFIFPPRPQQRLQAKNIGQYDNGHYYAQAQFGGHSIVVVINEDTIKVFNRKGNEHFQVKRDIVNRRLYKGVGTMVLTGEYIGKGHDGEYGLPFKDKFIIWDILVHDNQWLVGETFQSRMKLLESLFPASFSEQLPHGEVLLYKYVKRTEMPGIYLAANIDTGFDQAMREISHIPAYDGLILKKKAGRLEAATAEKNNDNWQLIFKKPN